MERLDQHVRVFRRRNTEACYGSAFNISVFEPGVAPQSAYLAAVFFALDGGGVYSGRLGSYLGFGVGICAPTSLRQAWRRLRSSATFFGSDEARSRCSPMSSRM